MLGGLSVWLVVAAVAGASGVIFGAFGAHALRARLSPDDLAVWHTAVTYQLLHAVALLALALYGQATHQRVGLPAGLMAAGIVLFSGSLYLLATAGWRWLGPITPLGGLCFIAGWLALLWTAPPRPPG